MLMNLSNFEFIDSFYYYISKNMNEKNNDKLSNNNELNQAIELIIDKNFMQASKILMNIFVQPENSGNLLIYFLIFFTYAKSDIPQNEYLACCDKMQEMFNKYGSYSFLWEKAHILLKLKQFDIAQETYELVLKNHKQAIINRNEIINTKEEYIFLKPIFQKYGKFLHKYNNLNNDRANDIINGISDLGLAQTNISNHQETMIIEKLQQFWQEYHNGNYKEPAYQGIFKNQLPAKKLNILYIGYTKMRVFENATKFYIQDSIQRRGHNFFEISIDKLHNQDELNFLNHYDGKDIFEAIEKHQINIVFLDYNVRNTTLESVNFINIISKINNILKIPVIRYVMDYINCGPKIPQNWYDAIDMLLSLNQNITDINFHNNKHKFFYLPLIALNESNQPLRKNYNFTIIGSDTEQAQRYYFIEKITEVIKNGIRITLTDNNNEIYSMKDYIALYQNSKITFNTGCRNFFNGQYFYISTFRINEAIVNKCLLLEEGTMSCEDIYVPFVHYIPVYNRNDVMIYAQFFLKHEEWREKIVNEAYNFWQENYSYNHIWSEIERRLGFL